MTDWSPYSKLGGHTEIPKIGGPLNYALAATADNSAYTLSVPSPKLDNGNVVVFKMPNANSGVSATLNVNSLGAKKMLKASDQATQIGASDLLANAVYLAIYDTTLDSASGAWVVLDTPNTSGFVAIAGAQTITGAKQFAVPFNYALAVRASSGHFTAAVPVTALTPGLEIKIKMPAASDATSALAVNSLAEKKMLKMSDRSTQIGASDMASGGVYQLVYDDSVDSAAGAWLVVGL